MVGCGGHVEDDLPAVHQLTVGKIDLVEGLAVELSATDVRMLRPVVIGGNDERLLPGQREYGAVMLLAAIAYYILQNLIIADQGRDSKLAVSIGRDLKGKLSLVLYAIAIVASFFQPWASAGIYVIVALLWLVPDRRIGRVVDESGPPRH